MGLGKMEETSGAKHCISETTQRKSLEHTESVADRGRLLSVGISHFTCTTI